MIDIKIKKLRENARIPTRSSKEAAGYDLYACLDCESLEIFPHTNVKIGTGFALEIPDGYFAGIFARSGIATKQSLRPANCVGIIDSDYRGEYFIPLFNDSDEIKYISNNERIAQLVILPYPEISFKEVNELSTSERGEAGFGSTGK